MADQPPFECRICRDVGPAFHRAVDIVMNETSCDVAQWAADAVNCLIEAGWVPPSDE